MGRAGSDRRRRRLEMGEVSTLPLIALFVILVTFLVASASSAAVSTFPVDVPVVGAEEEGERGESGDRYLLVVHVLPDAFLIRDTETDGVRARIERSDGPADLEALAGLLAEVRAERPDHRNLILIPDPDIPYERVVDTADRARAAGLTHVSLASRAPETAGQAARTMEDEER